MKSNYEERKANRLAAYQGLEAKNEQAATQSFDHSRKLGDVIPMGQPILLGHHSERGHRSHLKKMDNAMRKGVEHSNRAEYYAGKAESLLNNTAISSDDPNAIDKLEAKLANLLLAQELYKDINKIFRNKKLSDADKAQELFCGLGLKSKTVLLLMTPDRVHGQGIPSYKLTNNNGVIKNTRDRIAHLKNMAAIGDSEETINGVRLVVSQDDNRVQLFFPGIPAEAVRKELKSNGFRWTPSLGCWQRQISSWAIRQAKEVLTKLTPAE